MTITPVTEVLTDNNIWHSHTCAWLYLLTESVTSGVYMQHYSSALCIAIRIASAFNLRSS